MFDDWRERRRLRRQIATLVRAGEEEAAAAEGRPSALAGPLVQLELLEYQRLIETAHRLGIDYQPDPNRRDGYEITPDGRLGGPGYAKLRKAIRDERLRIAESWAKILVPVITALTGLLGLVVTLITVARN